MTFDHREEGITHINVYSRANSLLGRGLSNFSFSPIVIPEHGQFMSIEGYWYWLSCRDDKLRTLHGPEAKRYGKQAGGKDWIEDKAFKAYIRRAIAIKLDTNLALRQQLKDSFIPLDHYYVFNNKMVGVPQGDWIIEWIHYCRQFLQINPNFTGNLADPLPKGLIVKGVRCPRNADFDSSRLFRVRDDHTFCDSIYTWTVGLEPVKYQDSEVDSEGRRIYNEERHVLVIAEETEQVLYGS